MTLRDQLDEASSALNTALAEAEERLCGLMLGVPAHVEMSDKRTLRFRKHGAKWGLFVGDFPIFAAPRADRIAAAQWLGKLLEQIHMNAQTTHEELQIANEAAKAFLTSVAGERRSP